jgi:hypothetical protein
MPLVDSVLEGTLKTLFDEAKAKPMSDADFAKKLAKIIDDQIKTAQVNPGIPVTTPVGPGSTSGPGALS